MSWTTDVFLGFLVIRQILLGWAPMSFFVTNRFPTAILMKDGIGTAI